MSKIRTRKRGKTWSYNFDIGTDPVTGKRKMIEKGGFENEDAAYDAGVAAYTSWKHGNISITSEKITVKEYLENWLENASKPNVKQKTYENYRLRLDNWVLPYLSNIVLQELKPRDVDLWIKKLASEGKSKGTIISAKGLLSAALNYAVYPAELIRVNPTLGIKIPRYAPTNIIKRTIISKDAMHKMLLQYPVGHKYHIFLLLAYHTGMRLGEILGLDWKNVDIDNSSITVMQQIEYNRYSKQYYFETPKTPDSQRQFFIDPILTNELKKWKSIQSANELKAGTNYQIIYEDAATHNLVMLPKKLAPSQNCTRKNIICTCKLGEFIHRYSILAWLNNHGINAHSFRHTHATMLVEAGAKPKDVAARLGHKDAAITENLYTHDTDEMKRQTVAIFAKSL
jgi:integrase